MVTIGLHLTQINPILTSNQIFLKIRFNNNLHPRLVFEMFSFLQILLPKFYTNLSSLLWMYIARQSHHISSNNGIQI
jgi:hypothetical protein